MPKKCVATNFNCLFVAIYFHFHCRIGREPDYYEAILNQVNGVLLPGGAVCLDEEEAKQYPKQLTNDCVRAAALIYDLVMKRNAAGEYFPYMAPAWAFS